MNDLEIAKKFVSQIKQTHLLRRFYSEIATERNRHVEALRTSGIHYVPQEITRHVEQLDDILMRYYSELQYA